MPDHLTGRRGGEGDVRLTQGKNVFSLPFRLVTVVCSSWWAVLETHQGDYRDALLSKVGYTEGEVFHMGWEGRPLQHHSRSAALQNLVSNRPQPQ